MAETTSIEWCDATFNPWIGCTRVSPACDDCYAARSTPARAMGITWGAGQPRRRTAASTWKQPEAWERGHAEFFATHGRRRRVFCASLADVFDNEVPPQWREDLFDLIRRTPNLDWLLLTKRIGNAIGMVRSHGAIAGNGTRYLPDNAWLGATVANQPEVDRDVVKLLRCREELGARVLFLSIEPMLGPIDLTAITVPRKVGIDVFDALHYDGDPDDDVEGGTATIDWVIVGGESGPKARPMHPQWARDIRDQCAAAGVPFMFKQWGTWGPYDRSRIDGAALATPNALDEPLQRVGKKAAGRLLDGRTHDGFPEQPHA